MANDSAVSGVPHPSGEHLASTVARRIALVYVVGYAWPALVGVVPGIGILSYWWRSALSSVAYWTLGHVAGLPPHSPPLPSWYLDHRPDDLVALVGCLLLAALAVLVAAGWTVARPRPAAWERAPSWAHVLARFALAGIMFSYAWGKLLPQQFNGGQVPLPWLLWRLGDFSPQHLLWIFMGYSRPYAIFAGAGEMLGALLLCFRRTSTVGALILIAVLSNVVAMNFAYDVGVKIDAVNFLLMAVYIFAPEARRVGRALLARREGGSTRVAASLQAYLRPIRFTWLPRAVAALATVWLLLIPLRSISENIGGLRLTRSVPPPYAGIFEVEPDSGGEPEGRRPWTRWRRLALTARSATALTATDSLLRYGLTVDTLARRMRLADPTAADAGLEFTYSLSDSVVTLRAAGGEPLTLRRMQPTLLRWTHLWAW